MAITVNTAGSQSVSTTEFFLASVSTTATYQTTTCSFQAYINFSAMLAGDQFRVRVYRKINSTVTTLEDTTLNGVQSTPYITTPYLAGGSAASWEISIIKVAGTDRTITWDLVTVA